MNDVDRRANHLLLDISRHCVVDPNLLLHGWALEEQMRRAENRRDEDMEGFVPPTRKKKKRTHIVHLEEKPVVHLDVDTSSEVADDGADSPLHNARSERRRAGMRKSPDPLRGEPKNFEVGESSGHGYSSPSYELGPKILVRQAFGAVLDSAAIEGKFPAEPSPVDPSASIPQISGVLLMGFNFLQPFLEDESEYLDMFACDVRALDRDLYIDSLRGAALSYVRLQHGLDLGEEMKADRSGCPPGQGGLGRCDGA